MPNFWQRLFDFSFKEFVTPSIIRFIYIILLILIGLGTLAYIVIAFTQGFTSGLITLIISPLAALLWVILARVYLEVVMVLFNMLGLLQSIAKAKGVDAPSVAPPAPPVS